MAVLSDKDLKRILAEDDGIIILRRREKSITGPGYDLTIGFIRDAATGEIPNVFTDEENFIRYTLLAGHRYLVISKEFLYLSSQYMATIHSRGSYALKGIIVTSTTVDPNYAGCITASLFNCSQENIHIKKDNQFATMVFHRLCTPTNFFLPINERGNPMDTQETFHGKFSNIHPDACDAGDTYYGQVRKAVEPEYLEAIKRMYQRANKAAENNEEKRIGEENFSRESEEGSGHNIKITFLVGNGFDLKAGLKTSYRDFYSYYIEQYPEDWLAQKISENMDAWSDLELELGRITDQISPQMEGEFWDSEKNLENALTKYLNAEMERIRFGDADIRDKTETQVYRSLTGFHMFSQEETMKNVKNIMDDAGKQKEYSFISFNYTDTLEQCLNTYGQRFALSLLNISSYRDQKVLHVHGSLRDHDMVLGVNDEEQILNKNFRDNNSRLCLIKSCINDSYKNTRTKDAQAIIDSSDIICIFGMSLGKTDQMWWYSIATWLRKNDSHELIIFSKEEGEYLNRKLLMIQEQKIRDKFFENGKIPENLRNQIEGQIHVIINSELFAITLT